MIAKAIEDAKKIEVSDKEIIIIDNGSTDGTKEYLQSLNEPSFRFVLQERNMGFARTIETGLRMAHGVYTYIHHADNEYDYRSAVQMLEFAEQKQLDIVIGSRIKNFKGSLWNLVKERPEYLATIISTGLINFWYKKNFTDIIGSRLYKTNVIKNVPVTVLGAGFDFESITRICKMGLKIEEISIGYKARENKADKKIKPYHMVDALLSMLKTHYWN
jgi:glycosyltransferase involved in cell wall biosynthesis